jgi:hypothetical protein
MLFLYRPRQTMMPYSLPRRVTQQDVYRRQLQHEFETPAVPRDPSAVLAELDELHASGVLTDDEFAAAKARVLASPHP